MYARTFVWTALLFAPVVVWGQSAVIEGSPVPPAELYAGGPAAPVIKVAAGEDGWYKQEDLTLSWELPAEVTAVAAQLFDEPGQEPMDTFRPPVSSITLPAEDLPEGLHYLSVQFRNEEKWGMYAEVPVNIDATAPQSFAINIESLAGVSDAVQVSFEARDDLSGVAFYDIRVGNQPLRRVALAEARAGVLVGLVEGETLPVSVIAYDKAGNERTETITIFGGSSAATAEKSSVPSIFNTEPIYILAGVLAAMMLLMFGYMVLERQRYAWSLEDLREETDDVQKQLLRIFSALREEIYYQINSINSRKRLTKGEKSAVDSLNQALIVSESLIEREIKDVKKLLD